MDYKFKRRSFLYGLGGAAGLKVMLRNLEASAAGAKSPPRLLITYWPVGTVRPDFIPTSGSAGSPILKPFADAGLGSDLTTLLGLSTSGINSNGGGGHEAGVVKLMTGVAITGVRAGLQQNSDGCAGGPSFDQIFLKHAPALQRPGRGYVNSIGDARTDFVSTAAGCLSYAHETQAVAQAPLPDPRTSTGMENIPLLPTLSPLVQFNNLFATFVPTGTGGAGGGSGVDPAVLKALRQRKSVLDLSLRQLARLRGLAPSTEANKIDIHAQAIRSVETQLSTAIANTGAGGRGGAGGSGTPTPACPAPPAVPPNVVGKSGAKIDYANAVVAEPDDALHGMVGSLHMNILRAGFVCDLIRVGTFQWANSFNKVAWRGLHPGNPTVGYMHNPMSHQINTAETLVAKGPNRNPIVDYLSGVHTWYNAQMAGILAGWKSTTDGYGGNLLDHTVIPFMTDIASTSHEHSLMPALLLGGKALGFQHGQYISMSPTRSMNDFWLTVGQGFGLSATTAPLSGEKFVTGGQFTGPIDGMWTKPA